MSETATKDMLLAQAVDLYDFRPAMVADVDAVLDLYKDFFAESDWPNRGLELDPKRAWAWTYRAIASGDIPHLLAFEKSSGKLVGSICYTMDHNFTTKPFAHLDKFYVRRKWRRSSVGRVLLTLCLEVARADNAVCFNANILSGMKEVEDLKNMMLKMGFRQTNGIAMTRNLD